MLTFNGISKSFLKVNKVSHSILPPLSARSQGISGRAGVYDFGVDVGAREIVVTFTVKGNSLEDLRSKARELAEWLYQEELKTLSFSDEPDKTYLARVSGSFDIEEVVAIGQGEITFLCPDPFASGTTKTEGVTSGVAVSNNGTAKTFPVFTVTFSQPATYFKISLGSDYVRVTYNFLAGDVLVIDNARALIRVNGIKIMPNLDLESDFFGMKKGENSFAIEPIEVATVSAEFTERWL